jgi:membrane protease YdiL (CAAX protease family)
VIAESHRRPDSIARADALAPVAIGLLMVALATRPVSAVGLALTVGAGLVALAPAIPRPAFDRDATTWAIPLAVGLGGFVIARLLLTTPAAAFRPWVAVGSVVAAVAEEAVFRRLVYGWALRWGVPVAIGVSAVLFAAVHIPWYGTGAFWVDLGAGLLLSWQRWASGGWAVPAVTHSAANILQLL